MSSRFPNYGVGAQVLNDLGISQIRLITNNPRKIAGLKGYGLEVVDRVPLPIEANDYNTNYLATKAEKLGHMLLQTYLVTVGITWNEEPLEVIKRYERLEKLRYLAETHHLLLKEEGRPVGVALFETPSLIFHLGFDQSDLVTDAWYQNPKHPYLTAVMSVLDGISTLPDTNRLEFSIANGTDPMIGLQMQLDRHKYPKSQLPSTIDSQLLPHMIYSFN